MTDYFIGPNPFYNPCDVSWVGSYSDINSINYNLILLPLLF